MSEVFYSPSIAWKLPQITGFCKEKTSPFLFGGAKWKLKFIYGESDQGNMCSFTLKRLGDLPGCNTVEVHSHSVSIATGERYPSRCMNLSSSTLNEWRIWEVKTTELAKQPTYESIRSYWETHYFLCCITPGPNWISSSISNVDCTTDSAILEVPPCITSLCYDFGKFFNNPLLSDVILISGDINIYAHRAILAARSDVFAAMFQNDILESEKSTLNMDDMEPLILQQLIRYMYTGKCPHMSHKNVNQLYDAADKYGVYALKIKCVVFIVENEEFINEPESSGLSKNCSKIG